MNILYTRWHRFDDKGVKYIKNFPVGTKPINESGFTDWKRGTGPFSEIQLNTVRIAVRKACKGVPKSPEQKQKMSLAKLGVPKTEAHKQAMKTAWARRRKLISHNHHDDIKVNSKGPSPST